MKIFQSLRFRIILMCFLFALGINLLYGYVLVFSVKINDDELFNWHISQQVAQWVALYENDHQAFTHQMNLLNDDVLIGTSKQALEKLYLEMPSPELKQQMQGASSLDEVWLNGPHFQTEEGFFNYEFRDRFKAFHVLEAPLGDKILFYFVDITDFNRYTTFSVRETFVRFIYSILFVMAGAIVVGTLLTRRVVSPLKRLTKEVDLQTAGGKNSFNKDRFYKDEVGLLAHRIDHFLTRIDKFVEREKAFTRDASHELRTPVANSQAALEVIEELLEKKEYSKIKKILGRIGRANKDMAQLIESFLLLGREKYYLGTQKPCALVPVIEEAFEKSRFSSGIQDVSIDIDIDVDEKAAVIAPAEYLTLVIDNLIRNALQHGGGTCIYVSGDSHGIEISNQTDRAFHPDQIDIGIGLKIVARICEQLNWTMDIDTKEECIFRVSISFEKEN